MIPSAIGLLHVFPVQTKRIRLGFSVPEGFTVSLSPVKGKCKS